MAICRFYIQGNCRFGDRCWNDHPRQGFREERGDYVISANQRSLIRNPAAAQFSFNRLVNEPQYSAVPPSSAAAQFSFKKLLSDAPTYNKFNALQHDNRYQNSRSPLARLDDAEMQEEQFHTKHTRWIEPGGQFSFATAPRITTQPRQFEEQNTFGQASSFSFRQALQQDQRIQQTLFGLNQEQRNHQTLFGRDLPMQHETAQSESRSLRQPVLPSQVLTTSDPSTYTAVSELSENEKAQFLMQIFTLGKIPTRPPPQEMCV